MPDELLKEKPIFSSEGDVPAGLVPVVPAAAVASTAVTPEPAPTPPPEKPFFNLSAIGLGREPSPEKPVFTTEVAPATPVAPAPGQKPTFFSSGDPPPPEPPLPKWGEGVGTDLALGFVKTVKPLIEPTLDVLHGAATVVDKAISPVTKLITGAKEAPEVLRLITGTAKAMGAPPEIQPSPDDPWFVKGTEFISNVAGPLVAFYLETLVLKGVGATVPAAAGTAPIKSFLGIQTAAPWSVNGLRALANNQILFGTNDVLTAVGKGGGVQEAKDAFIKSIPTAALFTVAQVIPFKLLTKNPWIQKGLESTATGTAFAGSQALGGETDPGALAVSFLTGFGLHAVMSGVGEQAQRKGLDTLFKEYTVDWQKENKISDAKMAEVQAIINQIPEKTSYTGGAGAVIGETPAEAKPVLDQFGKPIEPPQPPAFDAETQAALEKQSWDRNAQEKLLADQAQKPPGIPGAPPDLETEIPAITPDIIPATASRARAEAAMGVRRAGSPMGAGVIGVDPEPTPSPGIEARKAAREVRRAEAVAKRDQELSVENWREGVQAEPEKVIPGIKEVPAEVKAEAKSKIKLPTEMSPEEIAGMTDAEVDAYIAKLDAAGVDPTTYSMKETPRPVATPMGVAGGEAEKVGEKPLSNRDRFMALRQEALAKAPGAAIIEPGALSAPATTITSPENVQQAASEKAVPEVQAPVESAAPITPEDARAAFMKKQGLDNFNFGTSRTQGPPTGLLTEGVPSGIDPTWNFIPASGEPGSLDGVNNYPKNMLKVDPGTFQHKRGVNLEQGGAANLQGTTPSKWDESKAKPLTVWGQVNGDMTVANGHTRNWYAQNDSQVKGVPIRIYWEKDGWTAPRVEIQAALENMSEPGNLDSLDVGKFLRRSGLTVDDLKNAGVPLSKSNVEHGIGLAGLTDRIWDDVYQGKWGHYGDDMSAQKGAALGGALRDNPAAQEAIYKRLMELQSDGKEFSVAAIKSMAEAGRLAIVTRENQTNLFGESEAEVARVVERGSLTQYLARELGTQKNALTAANKHRELLEAAGNKITPEENKRIAAEAKEILNGFGKYKDIGGSETDRLLNEYAERLAQARSQGEENVVKQEAIAAIHSALQTDARAFGVGGKNLGKTVGAGVREEAPGRGPVSGTPPGGEETLFSLKEAKERAPVFYSKMVKVLTEPRGEKGEKPPLIPNRSKNPGQLADQIEGWAGMKEIGKNKDGEPVYSKAEFNADELRWSGLLPWLQEQKGPVTKQQILDKLKEGEVQVKVVEKGVPSEPGKFDVFDPEGNTVKTFDTEMEAADYVAAFEHDNLELDYAPSGEGYASSLNTKFQGYLTDLPESFTNRREMLLTVPGNIPKPDFKIVRDGEWFSAVNAEGVEFASGHSEAEARQRAQDYFERGAIPGNQPEGLYRVPGAHAYGDTAADVNRFAHVFTADYVDPATGKKSLVITETQSDWAREGRSKGYQGKAVDDALAKYPKLPRDPATWSHETLVEAGLTTQEISNVLDHFNDASYGVPPLPFTKNWHEVALKQAIRYAAENGYDGVMVVNGDMVKQRYDLSKHYDGVQVFKRADGNYIIDALPKGSTKGYQTVADNVAPDRLDSAIGKDLADKVLKGEGTEVDQTDTYGEKIGTGKEFSGIDLKIGGEWANNLYDKTIPSYLKKYVKQWGAEVSGKKVSISEPTSNRGFMLWMSQNHPDILAPAEGEMAGLRKIYERNSPVIGDESLTHFDIPQAMRDSVLYKGQPLYSLKDIPQAERLAAFQESPLWKDLSVVDKAKLMFGSKEIVPNIALSEFFQTMNAPGMGSSFTKTGEEAKALHPAGYLDRIKFALKEDGTLGLFGGDRPLSKFEKRLNGITSAYPDADPERVAQALRATPKSSDRELAGLAAMKPGEASGVVQGTLTAMQRAELAKRSGMPGAALFPEMGMGGGGGPLFDQAPEPARVPAGARPAEAEAAPFVPARRESRGSYYWKDRSLAEEWAKENGWPTEHIEKYDKGWAVQSKPGLSAELAGPDSVFKEAVNAQEAGRGGPADVAAGESIRDSNLPQDVERRGREMAYLEFRRNPEADGYKPEEAGIWADVEPASDNFANSPAITKIKEIVDKRTDVHDVIPVANASFDAVMVPRGRGRGYDLVVSETMSRGTHEQTFGHEIFHMDEMAGDAKALKLIEALNQDSPEFQAYQATVNRMRGENGLLPLDNRAVASEVAADIANGLTRKDADGQQIDLTKALRTEDVLAAQGEAQAATETPAPLEKVMGGKMVIRPPTRGDKVLVKDRYAGEVVGLRPNGKVLVKFAGGSIDEYTLRQVVVTGAVDGSDVVTQGSKVINKTTGETGIVREVRTPWSGTGDPMLEVRWNGKNARLDGNVKAEDITTKTAKAAEAKAAEGPYDHLKTAPDEATGKVGDRTLKQETLFSGKEDEKRQGVLAPGEPVPSFKEFEADLAKDDNAREKELRNPANSLIPLYEGETYMGTRHGDFIKDAKGNKVQLDAKDIYERLYDPKTTTLPLGTETAKPEDLLGTPEKPGLPGTVEKPPGYAGSLVRSVREKFSAANISEKARLAHQFVVEHLGWAAREVKKDAAILDKYSERFGAMTQPDLIKFTDAAETGRLDQVAPDLQEAAGAWSRISDGLHSLLVNAKGGESAYWENYFPRLFENPEQAATAIAQLLKSRGTSLTGPESMNKARTMLLFSDSIKPKLEVKPGENGGFDVVGVDGKTVESFTDKALAEQMVKEQGGLGLTPRYPNYVDMMKGNIYETVRFLTGKYIESDLKDSGFITKSKTPGWEDLGKLGDKTLDGYYAHPDVARVMENFLSKGLRGDPLFELYNSPASFMNTVMVGMSAFHATFSTFSDLAHGIGSNLSRAIGAAVTGRFGLSGHYLAEMAKAGNIPANVMRGGKLGEEYTTPGTHPEMSAIVDLMTKAGIRFESPGFVDTLRAIFQPGGTSQTELGQMSKTFAEVAAQQIGIPRKVMETIAWPIMSYLVPRLKINATARLLQMELDTLTRTGKMKDMKPEDITRLAQEVARKSDNIFGQMVYDNLSMSRGLRDGMRTLVGFPGWNIGSFTDILQASKGIYQASRSTVGALKDIATGQKPTWEAMSRSNRMSLEFYMGTVMVMAVFGAITQRLLTGEWPGNAKDLFMPQTGELMSNGQPERLRAPTYMRDVLSLNHPFEMAKHKLNWPLRMMSNLVSNQDFFGTQIRDPYAGAKEQAGQVGKFVGKSLLPFGIQGYLATESPKAKALNLVGITKVPRLYSNSDAMNVIDEYNTQNRATMTSHEAEAEKSLKGDLRKLAKAQDEDGFKTAAQTAMEAGTLTRQQIKTIVDESQAPPGLGRFVALPVEWQVRAMAKATDAEKEAWQPYFIKKVMSAKSEILIRNRDILDPILREMGLDDAADAIQNLKISDKAGTFKLAGLGVRQPAGEMGDIDTVDLAMAKQIAAQEAKLGTEKKSRTKKNKYSFLGIQ